MIQITFQNQPSNIGSIQQFENKAHLDQWLIDNANLVEIFNINSIELTMDSNYGTIETI